MAPHPVHDRWRCRGHLSVSKPPNRRVDARGTCSHCESEVLLVPAGCTTEASRHAQPSERGRQRRGAYVEHYECQGLCRSPSQGRRPSRTPRAGRAVVAADSAGGGRAGANRRLCKRDEPRARAQRRASARELGSCGARSLPRSTRRAIRRREWAAGDTRRHCRDGASGGHGRGAPTSRAGGAATPFLSSPSRRQHW